MDKKESENNWLSIGSIARSFGVSENCIRRIEAAGLLNPAYISEKSGYRYYDSSDIAQISTVLTLRSFGFSNKDIRIFLQNPDDLSVLFHKLQDMQQTITNLLRQMNRRLKTDEPYKCDIINFGEAYCYTKEVLIVPHLNTFSGTTSEVLFEAIKNKLPIDYMHPIVIESLATDYKDFDPGVEQRMRFHIPLRQPVSGKDITYSPPTRAIDIKWSYPGIRYSEVVPIIDRFFESNALEQAGTLRATFDLGNYSVKNADISNTVLHILIPIEK